MMRWQSERKLWRVAGILATVTAMGFFAWCQYLFYDAGNMERWPLRLGIAGAFSLLAAISFLVTARVLGAMGQEPEGLRARAWKVFSYASIPAGVLTIVVEAVRVWTHTPRLLRSNHKAVFAAGAFAIMAGLVALIGERCVAHLAGNNKNEKMRIAVA